MPKKNKHKNKINYFDAFEEQARVIVEAANFLADLIDNFDENTNIKEMLEKAHAIEHEGDLANQSIIRSVATDFITPFDRDELIDLAHCLDNVIDYIEDVVQIMYMYNITEMHEDAKEFVRHIQRSGEALSRAMKDFRNFKKSKKFVSLIIEVSNQEHEADNLYVNIIHDLYANHRDDPIFVIAWTAVFNYMERCCDACEHTADMMNSIMLQNV
ncbi:MAG: DUF47 domain-containing protein [Eggerthellaceae bacterium]|jgi:predicted phosphate transport protein (TIGR00153 family)